MTCVYSNKEGKCTHDKYFTGIKPEYINKNRDCLFSNQDKCPQAD